MNEGVMTMRIILPHTIFLEKLDVLRIVAEGKHGFFGILPHRLDCVTPLEPGILTYETKAEGEVNIAVDKGIFVKTGTSVLISVRNAIGNVPLEQLQSAVTKEFTEANEQEHRTRTLLENMELGFIRQLTRYYYGQ